MWWRCGVKPRGPWGLAVFLSVAHNCSYPSNRQLYLLAQWPELSLEIIPRFPCRYGSQWDVSRNHRSGLPAPLVKGSSQLLMRFCYFPNLPLPVWNGDVEAKLLWGALGDESHMLMMMKQKERVTPWRPWAVGCNRKLKPACISPLFLITLQAVKATASAYIFSLHEGVLGHLGVLSPPNMEALWCKARDLEGDEEVLFAFALQLPILALPSRGAQDLTIRFCLILCFPKNKT